MTDAQAGVHATAAAAEMVQRLVREHGPLALFQSGGCCDGSTPICVLADELPPGTNDRCLGHVAGVPFYIDAEQHRRWGEPGFVLDIGAGAPEGFSIGTRTHHLITRASVPPVPAPGVTGENPPAQDASGADA